MEELRADRKKAVEDVVHGLYVVLLHCNKVETEYALDKLREIMEIVGMMWDFKENARNILEDRDVYSGR